MLCCSELKCDYIIVVFLVFLGDMSWTFMLNTFHPLWTYFNTQSFAGTYFNTQSCSGLASTYEVATSKTDQSFHQFQKSLRNLLHLNCYCLWPWMTLLSSIKYVLFQKAAATQWLWPKTVLLSYGLDSILSCSAHKSEGSYPTSFRVMCSVCHCLVVLIARIHWYYNADFMKIIQFFVWI